MHELGIAFHVVKEIEDFADKNNLGNIAGVTLEIGEVSGVVPQYLLDVWPWACEHRSKHLKGSKLNIVELKAISYCEDCKETYNTVPQGKKCPRCGGGNTYLVEGNEIKIQSIQTKENEPSGN
ncbi:MAG: hydrogenase maturation nickel metallochaperone HypA [Mollicutes bacterium]|nr:hydrogenase maturation nickel metallochaperone HypA [Mollicutes bacterium]MDD7043293.1 hydrogenase maturation nickel metallochaperone HypA [Mollicutes bacterium]MDY6070163.1 hydrogenase maturation nickel metallochaperone HypA [Bacilli bacterium]